MIDPNSETKALLTPEQWQFMSRVLQDQPNHQQRAPSETKALLTPEQLQAQRMLLASHKHLLVSHLQLASGPPSNGKTLPYLDIDPPTKSRRSRKSRRGQHGHS